MHPTTVYQNIRQKITAVKAEIENVTIVYGEIGLSIIDKSSRQKISKDRVNLNNTINQVNIIDMYRIFYPTTESYTFSWTHIKHSQRETIFWAFKHTLTHLKDKVWAQTNVTRNK